MNHPWTLLATVVAIMGTSNALAIILGGTRPVSRAQRVMAWIAVLSTVALIAYFWLSPGAKP